MSQTPFEQGGRQDLDGATVADVVVVEDAFNVGDDDDDEDDDDIHVDDGSFDVRLESFELWKLF